MTATAAGPLLVGAVADPGDPTWLVGLRRQASAWIGAHGFPTRHDEDWKYLDLTPILALAFEPVPRGADGRRAQLAAAGLGLDLGGPRLVFVDGWYAPALSRLPSLPPGVTVGSLATAWRQRPGELEAVLARAPGSYHHAFDALNVACAADGAFVDVPAGVTVAEPIHLAFVSTAGAPGALSSPRSFIGAGAGSQAAVVVTHTGLAGDASCTNAVTEIRCGPDARIAYDEVQDEAESTYHLSLVDVHQARGSSLSARTFSLGSATARHELRVLLEGPDAEVSLDGLYLPGGRQHHDHPVLVDHAAPHATSRQHFKGVIAGHGHGTFNGRIVVRPGADGTDAAQTNKNLLLSDQAAVDTRPRLEILADDVACTHGASVGQLDAEAVFYLRSRGIALPSARAMLVSAFADEMIERIPLDGLRAFVAARVADRVAAGQGEAGA